MNYSKIISAALIGISLAACSSRDKSIDRIDQLEKELYSNPKTLFDNETAGRLVDQYEDFAANHSDDSLAALYLFKAAEVAMGMNASAKAIALYNRVYTEYPDYEKASTALFLVGFVNETQVKNLGEAQKYYRKFIAEFPGHNLVDDARFSLDHLGKSDEEIIREFEAKRAEADQKNGL